MNFSKQLCPYCFDCKKNEPVTKMEFSGSFDGGEEEGGNSSTSNKSSKVKAKVKVKSLGSLHDFI